MITVRKTDGKVSLLRSAVPVKRPDGDSDDCFMWPGEALSRNFADELARLIALLSGFSISVLDDSSDYYRYLLK
jgi:hypothetical protein